LILSESSSSRLSLRILKSPNPTLWWTIGGGGFLLAIVLYVPFLRDLFSFSFLHSIDLAICLSGGAICVFWFELLKLLDRSKTDRVLQQLHSSADGLSDREAKQRLVKFGANSLKQQRKSSAIGLLFNQFKSPIVACYVIAAEGVKCVFYQWVKF
jgi:magnesium-transporting ATPase (P-type)